MLARSHTNMPAATAAARVSRASLGIGALGVATAVFLATRVIGSWRIEPGSHRNTVRFLGQHLSYPTGNAAALAVIALAAVGLAVSLTALVAGARELARSRRLGRALDARASEVLADGTIVLDDPGMHAFCAGLLRPRVYVTSAALARLDDDALVAVLAHEHHHARRRDPLRLAAGRVLTGSLFLVPWLRPLHDRHRLLAELGADESAAAAGTPALARAMIAFEHAGLDPERVDRLLDAEPPAWRFPTMLALAAAMPICLVAAAGALMTRFASGSATLDPPFLSQQPCIVVLATVPVLTTLGWWRLARMRS